MMEKNPNFSNFRRLIIPDSSVIKGPLFPNNGKEQRERIIENTRSTVISLNSGIGLVDNSWMGFGRSLDFHDQAASQILVPRKLTLYNFSACLSGGISEGERVIFTLYNGLLATDINICFTENKIEETNPLTLELKPFDLLSIKINTTTISSSLVGLVSFELG